MNTKKLCDCGFPQSSPVPHQHSLPETIELVVPKRLEAEFKAFLELGLGQADQYLDELTPKERAVVKLVKRFVK